MSPHVPTIKCRDGWLNQSQLVDARDSVHDVKLAPRHLGLRLVSLHANFSSKVKCDGATCLSWNKSRFDVPMIMVGGNSDAAKFWGYNNSYRKWQVVAELVGHTDAIHDVCWAPNMGQSFHLLATASKDRTVRIWRLTIHQDDHLRAEVKEVARKHHHDSEVWRVEWNVTGTMLASSGDDGTVRMWKSDSEDEWACVNTICGDLGPVAPPPMDLCTS
ncbi:hypothetical protein PsorP6_010858 [Peronosclerospora sorghi]|uniref:Uncharacterized protein n=1 Tax=Peronosclerospora sorghi TaxID=230839 RepID=A0ACC0VW59_9STRA|nr:hypothetical protein PsorP6_010858 [Peronosclerospora sorghi]